MSFLTRWAFLLALASFCAVLLAQTEDLTMADLGRHIKNGEILLHGSPEERTAVLNRNFYSFSEGDFPFPNHHWLTGVVFYLVYKAVDFDGLSLLYIALVTGAFVLFYGAALERVTTAVAAPIAVLVMPLITLRPEIRPEGFTYLFCGVYFLLLDRWRSGKAGDRTLYVLPVLMLLWVNLHVAFVFGFLLLGLFGLREVLEGGARLKTLLLVSGACVAAACVNPHFVMGLLYPLNIFRNYGYAVGENQSLMELVRLNAAGNIHLGLSWTLVGLGAASFAARAIVDRNWRGFLPDALFFAGVATLSVLAVRTFPLLALLTLPLVAPNLDALVSRLKPPAFRYATPGFAVLTLAGMLFLLVPEVTAKQATAGIGLRPGSNASAEFVKDQHITGPIFNNFDIGSYLVFHLFHPAPPLVGEPYPSQKVFVDNRPEAYPVEFFDKVYRPMQYDDKVWREVDGRYHFNAIFFSHRDATWWSQKFLIARVHDQGWAPVYADLYNLVLVRNTEQNQDLISKYRIPESFFGEIPPPAE